MSDEGNIDIGMENYASDMDFIDADVSDEEVAVSNDMEAAEPESEGQVEDILAEEPAALAEDSEEASGEVEDGNIDKLFEEMLGGETDDDEDDDDDDDDDEYVDVEKVQREAAQQAVAEVEKKFQTAFNAAQSQLYDQKQMNQQLQVQLAELRGQMSVPQVQQPEQPKTEADMAVERLTQDITKRVEAQYAPQLQQMQQQMQQYQQHLQQQQKVAQEHQQLQQREQQKTQWLGQADQVLDEVVFQGVEDVPAGVRDNFRKMMARFELYGGMAPAEAAQATKKMFLESTQFLMKAHAQRSKKRMGAQKEFPAKQPQGGANLKTAGKSTAKAPAEASFKHAMDVSFGDAQASTGEELVEFSLE